MPRSGGPGRPPKKSNSKESLTTTGGNGRRGAKPRETTEITSISSDNPPKRKKGAHARGNQDAQNLEGNTIGATGRSGKEAGIGGASTSTGASLRKSAADAHKTTGNPTAAVRTASNHNAANSSKGKTTNNILNEVDYPAYDAPPPWLVLQEGKRSSHYHHNSHQAAASSCHKYFSIPIPPVASTALQQALIQSMDTPQSSHQRKLRKKASGVLESIRRLQHDKKVQLKKIKNQSEKLLQAKARQQKGATDVINEATMELERTCQELERSIRSAEESEFSKAQDLQRKKIEEEFEKKFETQQQQQQQQEKKRKLEEDSNDGNNEDNVDIEGQAKKKLKANTSEISADPTTTTVEGINDSAKVLESDKLRAKVNEYQSKLDKMQEKKSEMVWLLKQVIKADAKRKAKAAALKKAATMSTSAAG